MTDDKRATETLIIGAGTSLRDAMRSWAAANGLAPTDDDWRVWEAYACANYAADPAAMGASDYCEPTFDGDGHRINYRGHQCEDNCDASATFPFVS